MRCCPRSCQQRDDDARGRGRTQTSRRGSLPASTSSRPVRLTDHLLSLFSIDPLRSTTDLTTGIDIVACPSRADMPKELDEHEDLAGFLAQYDSFLFDCDGVIWVGSEPIAGSVDAIRYLLKLGKRVKFITNNATASRKTYVKRLHDIGLHEILHTDVCSSGTASVDHLASLLPRLDPAKRDIFLICQAALEEELREAGITNFRGGSDPKWNEPMPLQDFSSIKPDPRIGIVLLSFDMHFNYRKICQAYDHLAKNAHCQLVLTNDDVEVVVGQDVACPGEGLMAATLRPATKNPVTVCGKPNKTLWDSINREGKMDSSRTLMIGDSLATDIQFAKNAGLKSLLVFSGATSRDALRSSDIRPDFVADSLAIIARLGRP
ncbi:uncharacterized protein L969DRAFT_239210 [Mixia osmundae IAM 14324]|uniref:4-nitrophenylphosphatase n=1 Tax=Mixia osmundae (strain CBS 9802 / IAM 14324 / JCM 22182 / KY 12970) TaxID=764103 RepID=G7E2N0_MIXOS|nr:uncharacterized protein L969DRAFT_239210 [Mixia osmundae IAM 14324]KEI36955.1 hypothetical protein L969DRAFT_239210 [Mixia osmundae IAM 14324]GAA97090.1 hypothetical protein E5Q_03765 [Mixia osmundae IAM 14324]